MDRAAGYPLGVISGGFCLFILAAPLAVIWAGPVSNMFAGHVTTLISAGLQRSF